MGKWFLALLCALMVPVIAIIAVPWYFVHRRYGMQVLIAYDQLLNAYTVGYPDEMISARAWRSGWRWRRRAIDLLFLLLIGERDHCMNAYMTERMRGQLPHTYHSEDLT